MKSYVTQKLIILLIAFISVRGFGSSVYNLKYQTLILNIPYKKGTFLLNFNFYI